MRGCGTVETMVADVTAARHSSQWLEDTPAREYPVLEGNGRSTSRWSAEVSLA
jgi:hypothetical protein